MFSNGNKTFPSTHLRMTWVAAAISALALVALPAGAQTGGTAAGTGSGTGGSSASGAPGVTSKGAPGGSSTNARGNTGTAGNSAVARVDSKVMVDLAQANVAEIETGKLALEKSPNEDVKKFAQHMIDDHTKALQELQTLAQSKGVKLPDGTDVQHKTMATAMKALSGNAFDNQYMKRVGVNDHQRTIDLLQKAQKSQDPEIKAMADKMIPTVQSHLKMAQETQAKTGNASRTSKADASATKKSAS